MTATLRKWFDQFERETGERPTHIVFESPQRRSNHGHDWDGLPTGLVEFDIIYDRILDRQFDDDFGVTESPDLCAWSPSWALFTDGYDGAEELRWVPRHPREHDPIRPGGG